MNHQELYEKYKARLSVLNKIRNTFPDIGLSNGAAQTAVLESLGVSTEDFDWATVVKFFYESLHSELSANLKKVQEKHNLDNFAGEPKPWKAVGDELIYQFVVHSRQELHWIIVAFLAALCANDGKVNERGGAEHGLRSQRVGVGRRVPGS